LKKVIVVVCVVCLVVSLFACSKSVGAEAFALYTESGARMAEVSSVAMDVSIDGEMIFMGMSIPTVTTGSVQQVTYAPEDMDFSIVMDTSGDLGGEAGGMETFMYYRAGVLYTHDATGQKSKKEVPVSYVLNSASINQPTFELDAIRSAAVTDTPGGKKLNFVLKSEAMQAYAKGVLGALLDTLADSNEMAVLLKDVQYEVLLTDDGLLDSYVMTMDVSFRFPDSDQSIQFIYTNRVKVTQVGDVVITFPDDLNSYKEID